MSQPPLALIPEQHRAVATDLRTAERTRVGVLPPTGRHPDLTIDDAYAIQMVNIEHRIEAGESIVGHKVGLTAKAMQEMMGVTEPDFGHLLDSMVHDSGVELSLGSFLQPRIEPEIAFRLGRSLRGPGVTAADVMAATDAVAASLEIVDSRVADWKIALLDTIADNASSAAVVQGTNWIPLADAPNLPEVAVELVVNGEVVERGLGAAVLGDPAEAVAWLANTLARHEVQLEPGQVILPGSCTGAPFVNPGDMVEARFTGLGTVRATFTAA